MTLLNDNMQNILSYKQFVAAHPGKAFAETKIIGRTAFRRFALRPVPVSAILDVDDINRMVLHDSSSGLKPEIIDEAEAFFKNLRRHDRGADR